jgi:UDP-2-acetamido-3-amino-2,3-dideoxy-glucuronate N-acetyltransferase
MSHPIFSYEFDDERADSAFIHESSYVDRPCRIGERTHIMHFSHVMSHAIIGHDCHIGHNVTIGSGVIVGNHVRVMNNALLISGVILDDEVYCGPSTVFTPVKHVRGANASMSRVSPTVVRKGASIGANTTIAAGHTIGQHAFVEPNTVIDTHVPDFAVMSGHPLRLTGWRCGCGESLAFGTLEETECEACGERYERKAEYRVVQITTDEDSQTDSAASSKAQRGPRVARARELPPNLPFVQES